MNLLFAPISLFIHWVVGVTGQRLVRPRNAETIVNEAAVTEQMILRGVGL